MSNVKRNNEEPQEGLGFSLTKAVEDVSHLSFIQTEALKEKKKTLSSLQATHCDVETKCEMAEQELRCIVRETLVLESNVERLERRTRVLHNRCASIGKENTELQILIFEQEENVRLALAGFNTYRNKMEGHRAAVMHVASQTEAHKELEEKRAQVRMLKQEKEELKEDLENSNGKTAHVAKRENESQWEEISAMRQIVAEKAERLQKEFETHTQMKKDIQIHNRRYEAMVKRLHCQLSRAQAAHRQISEGIYHMKKQLAELKAQQESSEESVVHGYSPTE